MSEYYPTPPHTPIVDVGMDSDSEETTTDIEYEEDEELVIVPRNLLPELLQVAIQNVAIHLECGRSHCLLCLSRLNKQNQS